MSENNLKIIDHSEELRVIKQKHGERYYVEQKATQDAADLWGLATNEHGVASNYETEVLIQEHPILAEIYLARTLKDHWLIGVSAHTSMSGFGYAPSAWDRIGYADYNAARKAAIQTLKDFFIKSASDKEKPVIIRKLAEKEFTQLSLF